MATMKENETSKESQEIAAYYHWLNRGCPNHDALCDWMEAGRELAGASKGSFIS